MAYQSASYVQYCISLCLVRPRYVSVAMQLIIAVKMHLDLNNTLLETIDAEAFGQRA